MKTAIVTFVRAYNHGAVLQCYALHETLNKIGVENEVLDYYPIYFRDFYSLAYLGKLRYFPYRPLRNWMKYTPMLIILKKRTKGFEKFIRKNIKLSEKQYYTQAEINEEEFQYDSYIAGSDQVWSDRCAKFDPIFFLNFKSADETKKYSYAASFGFEKVPMELEEEYVKRLSAWDAYSVREESGVDIIYDLLGEKAVQCCDPTLLLTKQEWEKLFKRPKNKEPYILMYYVNSDKELPKYAEKLSTEKGMKVISITSLANYENLVGEKARQHQAYHRGACAPDEFLALFSQAEYVLTDSFHGTVFSLIFHKKFLSLTEYRWGKNHRVIELLEMLGIGERQLTSGLHTMENEIPWEKIDKELKKRRDASLQYLKSLI